MAHVQRAGYIGRRQHNAIWRGIAVCAGFEITLAFPYRVPALFYGVGFKTFGEFHGIAAMLKSCRLYRIVGLLAVVAGAIGAQTFKLFIEFARNSFAHHMLNVQAELIEHAGQCFIQRFSQLRGDRSF